MVSREVVTVPRVVPSLRTVAVPLTPTSSVTEETLDASVSTEASVEPQIKQITQAVQSFELSHVTLQTAISSVELCVHNHYCDRRSRSQEEIRLTTMETEIKNLLHTLQIPSSSKNIQCLGNESRNDYSLTNSRCLWNGDKNDERNESKFGDVLDVFKDVLPGTVKTHHASNRSVHGKLSLKILNDQDLAHVIHSWLSFIPIQTGSIVEMKLIHNYLFDLFRSYNNKFEIDWKSKLKAGIFEVLDLISIDSISNRRSVLNKLAEILIEKVKNICKRKRNKRNHSKCTKDFRMSTFQRHGTPTKETEVKNLISKEIKLLLEIFSLKLNDDRIGDIENDLISIFTNFMSESYSKNDKHMRNSILQTLHYHGLSEHCAIHFTDILMKKFKKVMTHKEPIYTRSENLMVFPTIHSSRPSMIKDNDVSSKTAEVAMNTNLVRYTEELCKEIDEWLNSLQIPQIDRDKGFRQVVVHDLAGDIVDRHKYLELNPTSRGSDATELEYLKYQIFKWVNKLVEENNLKPIEYAADLMRRIQGILQPILSRSRSNEYNSNKSVSDLAVPKQSSCGNNNCNSKKTLAPYKESSVRFDERSLTRLKEDNISTNKDQGLKCTTEYADQYSERAYDLMQNRTTGTHGNINLSKVADKQICKQSQKKDCCSNLKLSPHTSPSTEQLNEEYEQFVKDWVQQIPIQSSTPEELALADKARLGIHNGIWKAVTKLNCDPAIYSNRFLYEDILDDEIEDLINCLPQTPNLTAQKHLLKVKLIEKTVNTIEQIFANENVSFKNILIQNVANILQKHKLSENDSENSDKLNEELLIMKLVDEYILSTKYKDEDRVKAETYKNKLLKQIECLFENLKKTKGSEIKQLDLDAYKNDIIQTLLNVPLPDDNSIKEEADDVLLGLEIEEWISDLPVNFNDDYVEQYHRKKLRDSLVKNIKEMENQLNSTDDVLQSEMKNQIKKFLEKTSIKEGVSLNLDFIVDELTNRIKNRQKSNISQTIKRVAFIEPQGYEEFRDDIPLCSSLLETPTLNQNQSALQENQNSQKTSITQCRQSCGQEMVEIPKYSPQNSTHSSVNTNQPSTHNTKYQECCEIFDDRNQQNPAVTQINDNYQWHTLQDGTIPANNETLKKDTETQSPRFYPCNTSDDQYSHHTISRNKESPKLNSFNRSHCTHKNDDKYMPMYVKSDSSLQKNQGAFRIINKSQESQTRKGILATGQIAGCSRFDSDNKNTANLPFDGPTQFNIEYKDNNEINKPCCVTNDNNPLLNTNEANNSTSNSISSSGCQTENVYRNQSQSSAVSVKINDCCQRNVGTSASYDKFEACQETKCVSTPKNTISPITPRGPSKRRAKFTVSEKDAVRKRIDFDDSEEDDEFRCRCIERSWKCRRRPKYYLCDEYEDYPSILPLFYPYPCFL